MSKYRKESHGYGSKICPVAPVTSHFALEQKIHKPRVWVIKEFCPGERYEVYVLLSKSCGVQWLISIAGQVFSSYGMFDIRTINYLIRNMKATLLTSYKVWPIVSQECEISLLISH